MWHYTVYNYSTRLRVRYTLYSVVPELGGPGGPRPPPIFGRSVNPIQIGGGQIMPTITTGPPKVFHLPASLIKVYLRPNLSTVTSLGQGHH